MKKFIVIGNPIDHSLSPKLHNYWFKVNNINAEYHKKLAQVSDEIECCKEPYHIEIAARARVFLRGDPVI